MKSKLPHLLTPLNARADCPVAVLTSEFAAAPGGWQRILPAGAFTARDGRGPFVVGDRAAMEAIVARSRAYHGQTDMVVDYDHQALAAMNKSGQTAKAAGWIKALDVRDDGIWADIKWTAAASAAISAEEYRYLSPVIPHDAKGNVKMVLNVSLTNVPATHIEAFTARTSIQNKDEDMDKILAALGLAKTTSEDDVVAALNVMLAALAAIGAAAGLGQKAKPDEVQAAALAAVSERKRLVEATGLNADVKVDDAVAALTALKAGAGKSEPDPTKFVPIEQVTALATELRDLRTKVDGSAAEAAVDKAIKDGKVVPALRDWAISMFAADKAKFEEFVGAAPTLTDRQLKPAAKPGEQTAALTSAQAEAAKALGIDPKAYAATLAAEAATAA